MGTLSVGLALLALLFLGPGPASARLVLDFTGGFEAFSAFDAVLGWRFQTASSIIVDGLGFWDEAGNGLKNGHQVGLWTAAGSLLVSTTITNASIPVPSTSPNGRWLFNDIPTILLPAGDYVLGASFIGNLVDDALREATIATTIGGVTYVEPRLGLGTGLPFPEPPVTPTPLVVFGYFGPNLRTSIPEPSTLTLLGLGALGLLGYGWCRRSIHSGYRR